MTALKIIGFVIRVLLLPLNPSAAQAQEVTANPQIPIVVMPFTDGTARLRTRPAYRGRSAEPEVDASSMGTGVAEMLVSQLANTGLFRVLDRQAIKSVQFEQQLNSTDSSTSTKRLPGARFIITGTITECWSSNNQIGGMMGGITSRVLSFGMLGYNWQKTKMKLNVRIIDAYTGVLVATVEADGQSAKGSSLTLGGLGHGGFGSGHVGSQANGEAIAEAAARSVVELKEKIVAKHGTLLSL